MTRPQTLTRARNPLKRGLNRGMLPGNLALPTWWVRGVALHQIWQLESNWMHCPPFALTVELAKFSAAINRSSLGVWRVGYAGAKRKPGNSWVCTLSTRQSTDGEAPFKRFHSPSRLHCFYFDSALGPIFGRQRSYDIPWRHGLLYPFHHHHRTLQSVSKSFATVALSGAPPQRAWSRSYDVGMPLFFSLFFVRFVIFILSTFFLLPRDGGFRSPPLATVAVLHDILRTDTDLILWRNFRQSSLRRQC